MTKLPTPPKRPGSACSYTDREIDAVLAAYFVCSGNKRRAAEVVAETEGIQISPTLIWRWARKERVERYEKIREELMPMVKAQNADMHQNLLTSAGEIEAKAVERLSMKLDNDEIDAKDLSAVMQRAAIATGVHSDKQLLYSGQPTQIIARDPAEILRALKAKGFDFDGEAEEVPV